MAGLEKPATTKYNCYKVNQMGCDIHKLISNPFGDTQNWKLLDLQQVFSFPTEGFALGMTMCRTSGTTGKSNFSVIKPIFLISFRSFWNFLINFNRSFLTAYELCFLLGSELRFYKTTLLRTSVKGWFLCWRKKFWRNSSWSASFAGSLPGQNRQPGIKELEAIRLWYQSQKCWNVWN